MPASVPRFPTIAASAAIATGGAVLVGWYFRLPSLRDLHPILGAMTAHTAMCLVIAGTALRLVRPTGGSWQLPVARGLAALLVTAAVLTLSVSLFGQTITIDNLVLSPAFAGRMPTPTALVFLALGLGLLFIDFDIRGIRPTEFLAFAAAAIAMLALVAYLFEVVSIVDTPRRRPLAFHTVLVMIAVSIGILLVRPDRGVMRLATGDRVTGVVIRSLLPSAVGLPILLGWLATQGERGGLFPPLLTLAYFVVAIVIVFGGLVLHTAILVERTDAKRREAEARLQQLNAELELRVIERTAQLEMANGELESFSYSVSHDLRAPLRAIDGFSRVLLDDYDERLDDVGRGYLRRVRLATTRMGDLIEGLLTLARVTRNEVRRQSVDVSEMARTIVAELQYGDPARIVDVTIAPGLRADADPTLLHVALENLIGNAWKFTRGRARATIDVSSRFEQGSVVYFVRDNGAGLDMTYAHKLFGVFQRLHRQEAFEGTGIGLATVQRILQRHGGRIWVESVVDQGTTFFFTTEAVAAVAAPTAAEAVS